MCLNAWLVCVSLWVVFLKSSVAVHGESGQYALDRIVLDRPVGTIAFGSCAHQTKPQPFWPHLANTKPDVWLWTGDAVYSNCTSFRCLQLAFEDIQRNENYTQFVQATPFVEGTWDDHDYGLNDGGGAVPQRGLVKVVLLDTRYFRDQPLLVHRLGQYNFPFSTYLAAALRFAYGLLGRGILHKGDLLGEPQWQWLRQQFLEQEIHGIPVLMTIVVSSIQVFSIVPLFESWNMYSKSKQRLVQLILDTEPPGLHFISGDVHLSQLLGTQDCIPEITSSGLTHSVLDHNRVGTFVTDNILPRFRHPFYPPNHKTSPAEEKQLYAGYNYGTFELNLNSTGLRIRAALRDVQEQKVQLEFQRYLEFHSTVPERYGCLVEYPVFPTFSRRSRTEVLISGFSLVIAVCVVYKLLCRSAAGNTDKEKQKET